MGLLEQAIAIDPNYGPALSWAAICHMRLVNDGWTETPETNRGKATDLARQALQMAQDDPGTLANAAEALAYFGEDIGAMIGLVDRALALNPSFARGWYRSGVLRVWAGQPDLAIEYVETSLRLSPRERMGQPLTVMGIAYFLKRRFDEAASKLLLSIQNHPGFPNSYRTLAACYAHMGRLDEARAIVARLRDNALTAGTVMERTRTPLSIWFWAAYLVSSHTPGISAVQFQRQLGLNRYETAFQILHKLRAGMVRPGRDRIGGQPRDHVEIDKSWVGGRTQGEGRGVHDQSLVIAAVEVRPRKPENVNGVPRRNGRYAGRIRMEVVPDRSARSLCGFVEAAVEPGAVVVTDAWGGYATLPDRGYRHLPVAAQGDPSVAEDFLPISHFDLQQSEKLAPRLPSRR